VNHLCRVIFGFDTRLTLNRLCVSRLSGSAPTHMLLLLQRRKSSQWCKRHGSAAVVLAICAGRRFRSALQISHAICCSSRHFLQEEMQRPNDKIHRDHYA